MKTTLDTGAPGLPERPEAERAQVMALVQQFEGMLLTEMLRGIQGSDEDQDEGVLGLGGSSLQDTIGAEFGLALSRGGGLGLGDMLAEAMARQRGELPGVSSIEPRPGGSDVPRAEPVGSPVRATPAIVGDDAPTVTSGFGWRRDPFSGMPRFHAGTDLRAAYGTEVRATVGGTVAFAGERPGYGLTVVVDHGQGRQSLYAHLSAVQVAPGQAVAPGQEIALSGNSGRSTAPHLHVEAREGGRPVDPDRLAAWAADGATVAGVGEPTLD